MLLIEETGTNEPDCL